VRAGAPKVPPHGEADTISVIASDVFRTLLRCLWIASPTSAMTKVRSKMDSFTGDLRQTGKCPRIVAEII